MLKAKKDNKVVRIPDEKINEYKKLGYSIYDMEGNLVFEYVNPSEKLKKLEAENAELKNKISDLEGKLEEATAYAENADKKIEKLEAENAELKEKALTAEASETNEQNEDQAETKTGTKAKSSSKATK